MAKNHDDKKYFPAQKRLMTESEGRKNYSEGELLNTKNLNKLHAREKNPSKDWVDRKDTVDKGMEKGWEERHDKFQLGHNPMLMTDFEKELVAKEKHERYIAKLRYDLGIQGTDGGRFPRSQT